MKTRKALYLFIGIILITLNLIVDVIGWSENSYIFNSYTIGYFIGSHILLIFGLVLLRMAYRLHKRLMEKNNVLEKSIDNIGQV